jgi:hypothetical protein
VQYVFARVKRKRTVNGSMHDYNWVEMQLRWAFILCFLSFIFVREREMEVARRVAVAVDFSDCSKKALRWAVENVVRDGDYLILLTVRPSGNYEEGEMQL